MSFLAKLSNKYSSLSGDALLHGRAPSWRALAEDQAPGFGLFGLPEGSTSSASYIPPFGYAAMGGPDGSALRVKAAPASTDLLVQFDPGVLRSEQARGVSNVGGRIGQTLREGVDGAGDLLLVQFLSPQAAASARIALSRNPTVTFVETSGGVTVQGASDPYYTGNGLWGMYGDQTLPANTYGSHAGEAWGAGATGSTSVVIGVIDTGVDYTHPDLYLNIWLNQGEVPIALRSSLVDTDGDSLFTFRDLNQQANAAFVRDINANGRIDAGDLLADPNWENGISDDGDRYVDDLIGWDFANNDNDPYDDNNHGTHVSGTIAGIGGNGIGVAGVNWAAQVMPLKFLTSTGSGSLSNAILAVDYYTAAAKVSPGQFVGTNNSWGGGAFSRALQDSITLAAKQDLLFIAAAGNGGSDGVGDNNDATPNYPSSYTTLATAGYEAVVAVAAITSAGDRASYSNYGATSVDLGAPGSGIVSTLPGGAYGSFSGTSMATPHVTGALGLLASIAPQMTANELRAALLASATPTGSLSGITATGGRLDVASMLARAPVPDTSAPTATMQPADGATGVALNSSITLTFSEAVRLGSGTIVIADVLGNPFETYDVAVASANLTLAGSVLTINPTAEFAPLAGYTVMVAAGAITDLAGNAFVASGTYDFVTGTTAASLTLTGTAAANVLTGDSAGDTLDGKGGVDILDGRGGSDLYLIAAASEHAAAEVADSGVTGIDELRFTATSASTLRLYAGDTGLERVTLGTITATTALNVNAADVVNGLELVGNNGANTITGTAQDDVIQGQAGNDIIQAGGGNDVLRGGLGNDTLTGGAGQDRFIFDTIPNARTNKDTVADFVSGADSLQFDDAAFAAAGLVPGQITAAQFLASATATSGRDSDDRFIYNTKSGLLYFDADGSGSQASVAVALMGASIHPTLAFSDIYII